MSNYSCLNCGHDMDKHGDSGCLYKCHGEYCLCGQKPSDIANALHEDTAPLREEIKGLRRLLGWEAK